MRQAPSRRHASAAQRRSWHAHGTGGPRARYSVTTDSDGAEVANSHLAEATAHGVPESRRPAGHTHLIRDNSTVWLTHRGGRQLTVLGDTALAQFAVSTDGRQLAAWRSARAEEDRRTAELTAVLYTSWGRALVAEREQLTGRVAGLCDADDAQRAAAHADPGGDPGHYYRHLQPANEQAIEAARSAVEAFDADHPEIVAALADKGDADVLRFLDSD
ncbi:hypothetical protein ACFWXO_22100 [Kitasatospora sp. NPDC059088]|uniref:hypothetical protein n=1 Tax=Kitasatospora sp. NPDC059088 TaxID=3346722 RepID=UPI0036BF36F0